MKHKKTVKAEGPKVGPRPKNGVRAAQVRALHMKYPELNTSQIARRVGCSPESASGVLKRFLGNNTQVSLRAFQSSKADVFDAVQQRCLESVTDKKLGKASLLQAVTSAAILEDKSRIIRGMPTGMDVHVLLDIASMIRGDRPAAPAIEATSTKLTN